VIKMSITYLTQDSKRKQLNASFEKPSEDSHSINKASKPDKFRSQVSSTVNSRHLINEYRSKISKDDPDIYKELNSKTSAVQSITNPESSRTTLSKPIA